MDQEPMSPPAPPPGPALTSPPRPAAAPEPTPEAPAATQGLLDTHQAALLRYATHLLKDPGRAQDVVQDTFARYWQHPPPAEAHDPAQPGRLRAWLFTVCRNRAFDLMRKDRRMTQLTAPMTDGRPHPAPGPARLAEQRDTHAAVLHHLAALPGHQQEVVRLKFQAELTYKQIAEVTGLTVSNVGYLLHHALKTLRRELTPAD